MVKNTFAPALLLPPFTSAVCSLHSLAATTPPSVFKASWLYSYQNCTGTAARYLSKALSEFLTELEE
eukprot:scaffold357097_cov21-Prasinocladus_malaysianus.AAC.1